MSIKAREPTRPWIDTSEFTRAGAALSGRQRPDDFERLADLLAGDEGEIAWELAGERRRRPEGSADSFLRLTLSGAVRLSCVRCLEPVEAAIDAVRMFRIAQTESQAAREDADAEEFDVLAASPRFDVLELVEDEVIMALPIAPRHEACGLPGEAGKLGAGEEEAQERTNPFEVLRGLGRREKS